MFSTILLVFCAVSFGAFWILKKFVARKKTQKSFDIKDKKGKAVSLFNSSLAQLYENPSSKVSLKIKIAVSVIFFLMVAIIFLKPILGFIAGLGMYWAINSYFNSIKSKKNFAFEDTLTEALSAVSSSVQAGQSFESALENYTLSNKNSASEIFATALNSFKLGIPVTDALLALAENIHSEAFLLAANSIKLSRQTGGNLSEMLSMVCSNLREKKNLRNKLNALTAQARSSGLVMSFVPFGLLLLLYLMEPAMVGLLFSTTLGNFMLLVAFIMVYLGSFIIQKIVNAKS
ncbi:MAG: type II secretion system F family protein [Endomicrobiales bacterium]|nr:type II secretion system F family protein [Endomicrobiales bacterium]